MSVSLIAFSQGNTTVGPVVLAKVSRETARFEPHQQLQRMKANCSTLSYNVYSAEETEQLVLILSGDQCVCVDLERTLTNSLLEMGKVT